MEAFFSCPSIESRRTPLLEEVRVLFFIGFVL